MIEHEWIYVDGKSAPDLSAYTEVEILLLREVSTSWASHAIAALKAQAKPPAISALTWPFATTAGAPVEPTPEPLAMLPSDAAGIARRIANAPHVPHEPRIAIGGKSFTEAEIAAALALANPEVATLPVARNLGIVAAIGYQIGCWK